MYSKVGFYRHLLQVVVLLLSFFGNAQCPTGPVTLRSQFEVDDFSDNYAGCVTWPDDLVLTTGGIDDLSGLSQLTAIDGNLIITGIDITSLIGLQNITYVGGALNISGNGDLNDISSLINLNSVGGLAEIDLNINLVSLTGLNSLTFVGGYLHVTRNISIGSLGGLESLTYVGGDLVLDANYQIHNLKGLDSLKIVNGDIYIARNDALQSLTGIDSIRQTFRKLDILQNSLLSDCAAESICKYVNNPENLGFEIIRDNDVGCNDLAEVQFSCDPFLPVRFVSVGLEKRGKENLLTWTTTDESNNAGFIIEKLSGDDNHWLDIGFARPEPEVLGLHNYSFTDEMPGSLDNVFYRLVQVDHDGTRQYSKIVYAIGKETKINLVKMFPNPVTDELILLLETDPEVSSSASILLHDSKGQLVKSIDLVELSSESNYSLKTGNLMPGVFYVTIIMSNGHVEKHKLVKS